MLVDSCAVCTKMLWRPHQILCLMCEEDLRREPLLALDLKGFHVFSLFHYLPLARHLVRWGKGGRHPALSKKLTEILVCKIRPLFDLPLAGVIPIPPREPGAKDHAHQIARFLARQLETPLVENRLNRLDLALQKEKNERARARITIGASDIAAGELENKGVWLIADDVMTTGYTLLQAWRALGAPQAIGITLASTPRSIEKWPEI